MNTLRAKKILEKVFCQYPGNLAIRLWDGEIVDFGRSSSDCTLVFHKVKPFRDMILFSDPIRLAEAYLKGWVDIEGHVYSVLELKDHLQSVSIPVIDKAHSLIQALSFKDDYEEREVRRYYGNKNSGKGAIRFHYDISNDFYRLWLDEKMVYSCAYFEYPEESLEEAQQNKLDHICRKLRLQENEKFLDIGCGWGALLLWAAKRYGVEAHGVTLSLRQYEYAKQKIMESGLRDRVTVELKDYRELEGQYDKIASVGMFEHVGIKNLPAYFAAVNDLLKPGGLFLNHGITNDDMDWSKSVGAEFINQYVFPDGELDTISHVEHGMELAHFEILDVEAMRSHYALTLRHWVDRLEHNYTEAIRHVSEAAFRTWRLYMAGSALQFEEGGLGLYQILGAKRMRGAAAVPLTRRDIYSH